MTEAEILAEMESESEEAKTLFKRLLKVKGVGPFTARSVALNPQTLRDAVAGDQYALKRMLLLRNVGKVLQRRIIEAMKAEASSGN